VSKAEALQQERPARPVKLRSMTEAKCTTWVATSRNLWTESQAGGVP